MLSMFPSLAQRATRPVVSAQRMLFSALASSSTATPSWWNTSVTSVASSTNTLHHCKNNNNNSLDQQIRHRSNRSRKWLYNGKDIKFGNKISFSERKTRRSFKPNVHRKRLYSETFDKMIRFQVTTSALKAIDKYGGLDNYLLHSPYVTEGVGHMWKKRILNKHKQDKENEAKRQLREEGGGAMETAAPTTTETASA